MFSATLLAISALSLTCSTASEANQQVAAKAFIANPDASCEKCFHIVNLFSYDQEAAIVAGAIPPKGPQAAPNNFIQFFLDDPGQGKPGGATISWDPNYQSAGAKEQPPIGQERKIEVNGQDFNERAELVSWNGAGDFKVSVTHAFNDSNSKEWRVRQADLTINSKTKLGDGIWDCQKGSCRFSSPAYFWYPIYYCECYANEVDNCCANTKLNPEGRPKPPVDAGVAR